MRSTRAKLDRMMLMNVGAKTIVSADGVVAQPHPPAADPRQFAILDYAVERRRKAIKMRSPACMPEAAICRIHHAHVAFARRSIGSQAMRLGVRSRNSPIATAQQDPQTTS